MTRWGSLTTGPIWRSARVGHSTTKSRPDLDHRRQKVAAGNSRRGGPFVRPSERPPKSPGLASSGSVIEHYERILAPHPAASCAPRAATAFGEGSVPVKVPCDVGMRRQSAPSCASAHQEVERPLWQPRARDDLGKRPQFVLPVPEWRADLVPDGIVIALETPRGCRRTSRSRLDVATMRQPSAADSAPS